ncbi:MAG TPA: hypothetical protein VKD46_09230 [bacterium]|nr:hypothetical protein [bacterium]
MPESSLTMTRWWYRHRRSPLCLALYAVCLVIVLSFILFEVLDVDGSDFQIPTGRSATVRATITEEHADTLRRAALINAVAPLLLLGLVALVASSATVRQMLAPPTIAAGATDGRRYRAPLARASLPAPAV